MNRLRLAYKSFAYSWNLIFESSKFMIFLYFALKKAITDLGIWIGQSSNTLVYTRDCRENIYALEYFGKV